MFALHQYHRILITIFAQTACEMCYGAGCSTPRPSYSEERSLVASGRGQLESWEGRKERCDADAEV